MLNFLEKLPRPPLVVGSIIIVALLGYLDYLTGVEISFTIFYFLPITIIAWYVGLELSLFFSVICAMTLFLADYFGGHIYSSDYFMAWNAIMRLSMFLLVSLTIHKLKKHEEIAAKKILLAEKSFIIIKTSQRLTGLIVENISKYNSELLLWVGKQKSNGHHVSGIIESTCYKIGSNLRTLSEICFSQSDKDQAVELEGLIDNLHKKLDSSNAIFEGVEKAE